MKTMAFAVVGNLIVTLHGSRSPVAEEWDEYVKALKKISFSESDPTRLRNIVFTDGGAPNSVQRKAVNDIVSSKSVRSAIVSSSPLVRSVVTAFSWFNSSIKVYPPDDVDGAFQHLNLSTYEIELVRRRIAELRTQIEMTTVRAAG